MLASEWRCRKCGKLLGTFAMVVGTIKCPRCNTLNSSASQESAPGTENVPGAPAIAASYSR